MVQLSGQAILVFTDVDPVPGGTALAELRLTQPVLRLQAAAAGGRVRLVATANLEGRTIPSGELTLGAWGEGYSDRRHPHTYVHELMLVATPLTGLTIGAGKGFVPFGSDDPMSRPVERYPVNHHFSQILERAVAMVGVASGPVEFEGALFNGDEPERPGQWPRINDRFGDSWAVRLTVRPAPGVELQSARAKVHSPEHRPGAGSDQLKWSASLRWERGGVYGLAEWARTSELDGFFVFHTFLAEAAVTTGRHRPYYRLERTERPEEQRTLDPFRSVRPHLENSILGVTRWTIHTAGLGVALGGSQVSLMPFAEFSYGRTGTVGGGVFDPASFYGRDYFWAASLGLRVGHGMEGHRMGRYGVLPRTTEEAIRHSH